MLISWAWVLFLLLTPTAVLGWGNDEMEIFDLVSFVRLWQHFNLKLLALWGIRH